MPHQNVEAGKTTAQNAATDPIQPNDQARGQHVSARPEPDRYAAPDVKDSTLAPPAAGEVADYMDEGEAVEGEVHSGANRTNIPAHSRDDAHHGEKTQRAIEEQLKG
ncbi:hypothetical protein [Brevundimonas sp. R86498]|uniref:hypothetical protein n=1 Tax=Brevundimonas sp. R86498 TaxID=3093845 RepID=UPI0037C61C07